MDEDNRPNEPHLSGIADQSRWETKNDLGQVVDPTDVVFPIYQTIDQFRCQIVGTGFYVLRNGCFATARHVLEESDRLFAIHFGLNTTFQVRPVIVAYHHPTSDISLGMLQPISHHTTGQPLKNNVVTLADTAPRSGEKITTYGYSRQRVELIEGAGARLFVSPLFFDGELGRFHSDRGPSGRLNPPYFDTNIHLHGASSGGPVFSGRSGGAFAIANSSFDGAPDFSFVTPVCLLQEITIPDVDLDDGCGRRERRFGEILAAHRANGSIAR